MLFNSIEFIYAFLPVVLIGFFLLGRINRRAALLWLLSGSLFFYGWWDIRYVLLMIGSVSGNYTCISLIQRYKSEKLRKGWLIVGILFNVIILCYFKYTNFALDNFNLIFGTNFHSLKIILPIALSFYSFEQIAAIVDAYKGNINIESPLDYATFVTFFPRLVAGPIVRYSEIIPQFKKPITFHFNVDNLSVGATIFIIGLFKKVVIADNIAIYANTAFTLVGQGNELTFFEGWAAALAYTFQLYFDFSAYSDMAIGLGRMFNIILPINFQSPYKSRSFIEFWRRWHITLSRFLRDYLYIPLGGNRKGKMRQYANIIVTMLIGGLWHGAGWTFVLWGGIHGCMIVCCHLIRNAFSKVKMNALSKRLSNILSLSVTFFLVVCAWVVFRSAGLDDAISIFKAMFFQTTISLPSALQPFLDSWSIYGKIVFKGIAPNFLENIPNYSNRVLISQFSLLFTLCFFCPSTAVLMRKYRPALNFNIEEYWEQYNMTWKPNFIWLGIIVITFIWAFSGMDNVQEFLYYQF